jgi:hypothetical protein
MNSFLDNRPLVSQQNAAPAPQKAEPGFQPLFAPGTVTTQRPQQAPSASQSQQQGEPRIELVQSGGKVERIIVTCTCCNRIELQCQY